MTDDEMINAIVNAVAMGIGESHEHIEITVNHTSRGYSAILIVKENVERICRGNATPEAAIRALYRKVRRGMKKRAASLKKAVATMPEIAP